MPLNPELKNQFAYIWDHLEWHPSKEQLIQFQTLQHLLKQYNKQFNLTRLTEGKDYWVSQVLDSLWPIKKQLQQPTNSIKIIDVGTGCGFPGLALAIALPNSSVTLIDSISKKTNAVKSITKNLDLSKRVDIRTERIEITGQNQNFRAKYDLATARAVAKSEVLAEYLIPLLNLKGEAIIYKGKWEESENYNLKKALKLLNGKIDKIKRFKLPGNKGIRHLIYLSCTNKCPSIYPRSVGIPIKNPLNN